MLAAGRLPSSTLEAHARAGALLGRVKASCRGRALDAHVHLFALHREALLEPQLRAMADALVGQRHSLRWHWGNRRNKRQQQFLRLATALRDETRRARARELELARVLRPRVQPLFLLQPRLADDKGGDGHGESVKYSAADVEGRCWIWVCLPGQEKAKVTFKYRYREGDSWYSSGLARHRGNGWWVHSSDGWDMSNDPAEHSVWVDGGLVMDGIASPDAPQLVPVPADGTFPVAKGGLVGDSAAASMAAVHKLLAASEPVRKYHLSKIVFPAHMRFQRQKISASGNDLGGDLLFPKRIGFTGTPSDLLPQAMGKCGFRLLPMASECFGALLRASERAPSDCC